MPLTNRLQNGIRVCRDVRNPRVNDGQAWQDFEIEWAGLEGTLHENIRLFVVYTKNGDYLFAFADLAGR